MDEEMRLIRKIQKTGSRDAADDLIRKYYDEIYIYVYKQTSDIDTAMDITQEAFISMLKTIANYDKKQSSFRTWLYRIATNKTIDYFRSRTVQKKYILDVYDLELYDETEFTRQVEENDLLSRLQAHVNTMDIDLQQIFRLKFFGDYTFSQIASLMFLPESTVKTKYYRLLNKLREDFRDEY